MQVHGYPYSEQASTFILEMHEDVWRRAGFGDAAASGLAPGQSDEASIGLIRGLCADVLGGARPGRQQLAVDLLHHRALPDLAARQRRPARRRGAHRALLDRLGHQARHGGRAGPGRVPARAGWRVRRAGRLRGRTQAGGRLDPAGRAGQPGVVREHRPVRRPGPAPVRVQHRDPQPPGHLRQPPAARPGVRGGHGRLVRFRRGPGRARRGWSRAAAADVPAVPAGRPGAGEPGRRLANGHVLGPRRRARRLPPGAPGQQGAGRGRAGDDRDGLR